MGAWYYSEVGRVMGPLSESEVHGAITDGLLAPETPVWTEGMTGWAPLGAVTEFFQLFSPEQRRAARERMPDDLPPIPQIERGGPPKPPPVAAQPPYVQVNVGQPYAPSPLAPYVGAKSKVVAGVLGILLGAFGIHRFYLGYNGVGIVMLLLTVCTCGYGAIITGPWGLIEGILCLTGSMRDANGMPLSD